jgi:hypothetical protein
LPAYPSIRAFMARTSLVRARRTTTPLVTTVKYEVGTIPV